MLAKKRKKCARRMSEAMEQSNAVTRIWLRAHCATCPVAWKCDGAIITLQPDLQPI